MNNITLYAYTFASRAERIVWLLQELNLPFELIRLDPFKGETLTPEFGAINPQRKIPVLLHNGQVFTESLAIMEYLNELADAKLLPENLNDRYHYRRLMSYLTTEIEAYLWLANQDSILKGIYHWPEGTCAEAVKYLTKNLQWVFEAIGEAPFAVAQQFTLADIYCHQLLRWSEQFGIALPNHIELYLQGLESRPSFPRTVKVMPKKQ